MNKFIGGLAASLILMSSLAYADTPNIQPDIQEVNRTAACGDKNAFTKALVERGYDRQVTGESIVPGWKTAFWAKANGNYVIVTSLDEVSCIIEVGSNLKVMELADA